MGNLRHSDRLLARIMHRFSSRSAESAGLTRRATETPASVLYGTPSATQSGRVIFFTSLR